MPPDYMILALTGTFILAGLVLADLWLPDPHDYWHRRNYQMTYPGTLNCPWCNMSSHRDRWADVEVPCGSSSCSEIVGKRCPCCGDSVGHVWLDGRKI